MEGMPGGNCDGMVMIIVIIMMCFLSFIRSQNKNNRSSRLRDWIVTGESKVERVR